MKKRNLVYKTQSNDGSVVGPFSDINEDGGDTDILVMHPSGNVGPSGLGALADATHFMEVGHCIETTASGSAKLIKIVVHFN